MPLSYQDNLCNWKLKYYKNFSLTKNDLINIWKKVYQAIKSSNDKNINDFLESKNNIYWWRNDDFYKDVWKDFLSKVQLYNWVTFLINKKVYFWSKRIPLIMMNWIWKRKWLINILKNIWINLSNSDIDLMKKDI